MGVIELFNKNISTSINKESEFYKAFIGQDPFTPEVTIVDSEDFNCGAICNELEFARVVSDYYVASIDLANSDGDNLELLIDRFLDLPRRGSVESDATYRNRFKFINVEKANYRRTTKWAILDAISYFVTDSSKVQLIEIFDDYNLYFQIRFEGAVDYTDSLFVNSTVQGFIGQYYVGGAGVGEVISYIGELISRIKAAGVDFDILFIDQNRTTLPSDCIIGTIQKYLASDAVIKASVSITKLSDANIV